MKLSNIVVVPKLSMVQVDMHRYGLNETGLKAKYLEDGKDVDGIFESHERQMKSIDLLKKYFPHAICYREGFNQTVAENADLVIAAGGDDHLKYISHYMNSTPILGLNTDPKRSRGELLDESIELTLEKLERDDFNIRDETRIEALVNENPFLPGMSVYALARNDPFGNFRYAIEFKGENDEHKTTSGVIIYNGNGVTDWTQGAGRYLGEKLETFNPTEKKIGWVVREPHDEYKLLHGIISEGEELNIISYKDDSKICADGIGEHTKPVQSGDRVAFKIAEIPLRHVRMRE